MSTGPMPRQSHLETIGDFLLRRLKEVGLVHVFGVAGDFNLELLEQLESTSDLEWVGCCNELNAAYAADGYGRTHGIAALITTYGVGELSALCGVAGAYAEHVPIISISGAPPLDQIERRGLIHHTAGDGDYSNMMACGREFSVAQARLDPQNAVTEIDRCLSACVLYKQPVYIQLPSDIAYLKIATPADPLIIERVCDPDLLTDFVETAIAAINESSSIAILVDADIARFGQAAAVVQLADKLKCPIAVMGTAKGVIDETEPAYLGIYSGALSRPDVRAAIESVECLLQFGVRFIDSTTGSFSQKISPRHSIAIDAWSGCVDAENYRGIAMGDMLCELTSKVLKRDGQIAEPVPAAARPEQAEKITQAWFWHRMESFLAEDDVIVAENGTSLSGVAGISLPRRASVICQALWGAIGYSLPATFGSLMAAPARRHVLFIGDGSFQLTVQELSSILRHRLKPVIFLINNDGYTIERLILGETSSYNDIQPWKYAELCNIFAGSAKFVSRRVQTRDMLEEALHETASADACVFVEVVMDRMDAPETLEKLGPVYAEQDYGNRRLFETRSTTA